MSNTKHTPGPWTWDVSAERAEDQKPMIFPVSGGRVIALVDTKRAQCEIMPNAKLIAAAPELLDALLGLYNYTKNHINLSGFVRFEHLKQQAESAIKKATE